MGKYDSHEESYSQEDSGNFAREDDRYVGGLRERIYDWRRKQPQRLKSKAVWNKQFWHGLVPSFTSFLRMAVWSWHFGFDSRNWQF